MPHSGKIFEAKKRNTKAQDRTQNAFQLFVLSVGPSRTSGHFLGRPALMPWLQHQELPGGNPDGHCGIF